MVRSGREKKQVWERQRDRSGREKERARERERQRDRGVREKDKKRFRVGERKIGRETGVVERGRQELERERKK